MRLAQAAAIILPFLAAFASAAPVITVEPQDQAIGSGENGVLSVTASGATSYQWFKGTSGDTSTPVPGANDALCITLPLYTNGQFWVQASDTSGSSASRTVAVSITTSVPGRLMGMGSNDYGQLGGTETYYRATPLLIASGVTRMDGYGRHTLFIKEDGSLWTLGYNGYGQLGDGANDERSSPFQVPSEGPAVQVASGGDHSLFLRSDGTVWAMGGNSYGQLGIGNTSSKNTPQQVMTGAVQMAAGDDYSMFLKADGSLWATGDNGYGQYGNGTTTRVNAPIQVASGVAAVTTRHDHTLILKTDGTLWGAGYNGYGQLGDGSTTQRSTPVPIAGGVSFCTAGAYHSIFRKTDGSWWTMGSNSEGELGNGGSSQRTTPVTIGTGIRHAAGGFQASLWVKDDGRIWAMGDNYYGQAGDGSRNVISAPPKLTANRALRVTSAQEFSLFLDASPSFTAQPADVVVLPGQDAGLSVAPADGAGITYQWYRGASGDTSQPVGTGLNYIVPAPAADATYWVKITNAYGSSDSRAVQVSIATTPAIQTPPATANIDAGEGTALRVQASGGGLAYQWYRGVSGDISSPLAGATTDLFVVPPLYATQSFWARVSNLAGTVDSAAATITVSPAVPATLRASGLNSSRQLGTGDTTSRPFPEVCSTDVIDFDAGRRASHFIKSDHSLWEAGNNSTTLTRHGTDVIGVSGGEAFALFIKQDFSAWGVRDNYYGQLGDGSTTSRTNSVQVATNVARVSAGQDFSFLVKTDGSLWATGKNDYGQFGNGTWENSHIPIYITSGVIDAAAGDNQGFFLKADGTLWGMGDAQTLGIGNSSFEMLTTPVQIASGVARISGAPGHLHFLKTDGSLWSTNPVYPSYLPVQEATGVVKFAGGSSHTIFTKTDGTLWGLGNNSYGKLGTGNSVSADTPVQVSSEVFAVSAGISHSLFTDLKPGFTKQPLSAYVPTGTNVTLSVTGVGVGALSYQWFIGDRGDTSQPLASEVATTYTTPILTSNARYWVRITDTRGSWDSLTAVLTVVSMPQITSPPVTPAPVAYGGNAAMSVGVTGVGVGLSIQWYRGLPGDTSAPIAGATGTFFLTPPVTTDTSYWVRMSNAAGTVDSAAIPVTLTHNYPTALRSCGANDRGQLGIGPASNTPHFTNVGAPAVDIAAGGRHSLFLKADGSLWAMGDNNSGQLGDNTTAARNLPVKVADEVTRVVAGKEHSLFIKRDGSLWAMGLNSDNRLGLGSNYSIRVPQQVTTGVVQVSTGDTHTLFLKLNGSLWAMGSGNYGQTGAGYPGLIGPQQIASNVVKIAAGASHSLFLKSDGTVWATGLNSNGQLGDPISFPNSRSSPVQVASGSGSTRVVDIAAGGRHSMLLRGDGSVWTCGHNNYGQAGLGSTTQTANWTQTGPSSITAIAAGFEHSFCLSNSGVLYSTGRNNLFQLGGTTLPQRTSFDQAAVGVAKVAAGGSHTLTAASLPLITSQTLELGTTSGQTPTLSLTASGLPSLSYKWYSGVSGNTSQLLSGATSASFTTPPFSGDANYWVRVTGPGGSTDSQTIRVIGVTPPGISVQPQAVTGLQGMPVKLAVASTGGVLSYQWYYGSPGDTSAPIPGGTTAQIELPAMAGGSSVWVRVTNAAGTVDSQGAVITAAAGQLIALGAKSSGQIGDGSLFEYPVPVEIGSGVKKVLASNSAALLLKEDGSLWGAGANYYGELGDTSRDTMSGFVQIASNVADVQGSSYFTLFLKTDGTLWVMGYMRTSETDYDYYHEEPVQVASGVTAMSAGSRHYVYLTADGILRGAGDGFWGALGTGTRDDHYTPIVIANGVIDAAAGHNTTLFVKADGSLWGTGWNSGTIGNDSISSILSPVQTATGVSKVFLGDDDAMFIKNDDSLWGMGSNYYGQLGDGSNSIRTSPVPITTGVRSASPGSSQSFFIKTDGSLWGMGRNVRGELGDGSYNDSNLPVFIRNGVESVSGSYGFSIFSDSAGKAWAMGANSVAQFGIATPNFHDTPLHLAGPVAQVEAGDATSFFIKADGSLWGMGANGSGQLGDGSTRYRYTPVPITTGVKKISTSGGHTLFLKPDDSLWGMGEGSSGQLGESAANVNKLPIRITDQVRDMSAGGAFSLFIKKDNTLWGMGGNYDYQLSSSDYEIDEPLMIASNVARADGGSYHTLFLKTDGTLWAMGSNRDGQTGDGYNYATREPRQLASDVTDFAAGANHSVFITSDGSLWGVGSNYSGELGTSLPSSQTATAVHIATGVARVWAGGSSTLFLKNDGTLWGTGYNGSGQLGKITKEDSMSPRLIASGVASAAAGSSHTLFLAIGPVIVDQPESAIVAAGTGASFAVSAVGNPTLTYQWYRGTSGDTSDPVNSATATGFSSSPSNSPTNYWVRISNPYAHTDSQTVVQAIEGMGAAHYQSWASNKGLVNLATSADPDGDGMNNYEEYFFNTNPLAPSPTQRPTAGFIEAGSTYFTITFRRLRNTAASYQPQWSPDLAAWTPFQDGYAVVVPDVDVDGSTDLIQVMRRIGDGERKGFLRITVPQP